MNLRLVLSFLLLSFFPIAIMAAGIEVPDLETRIRNSGGDVPSAAFPELPNPAPTPLPREEGETAAVPADPAFIEVPDTGIAAEGAPESAARTDTGEGIVQGWASLGAGSPGTLAGALSVSRTGANLPDFELAFSYDAADGFGGTETGTGFFDRSIALAFQAGRSGNALPWHAAVSLSERTDGLQGMNTDLYSLTARDARWDASIGFPLSVPAALSAEARFSGGVFTAFADRPGTSLDDEASMPTDFSGIPIDETGGYRMDPGLVIRLTRERFALSLGGTYGYETIVGTGERNVGLLEATADAYLGHLSLGARAGAYLAADSGVLGPFSLSAIWKDEEGLFRALSLSGGLDAYRSGTEALAETDPFTSRNRLGETAADWFGRAGADISFDVPAKAAVPLTLSLGAEYRGTAFDRGILASGDLDEPSDGESAGLVPVSVRSRASLATELALAATGSFWSLGPAWNAEWLDGAAERPAQLVSASFSLFDPAERRLWEIGTELGFAPAEPYVPRLDLAGTLRPARSFSLTLSFDDIVPLAAGKPRMRNAVYADRSGVLALTGRLDF